MDVHAGIDLHGNNNYIGLADENGRTLLERKMPNDLEKIFTTIEPFKEEIKGIVVESTFNGYWIIDGLMERGLKVHLANPAANKQYDGLKYSDDRTDALHLAKLLRLGILEEGYIYPKETRAIRDLLRKRLLLVKHRTSHIISFKSMVNRWLGKQITTAAVKDIKNKELENLFSDENQLISAKANIETIRFLKTQIWIIEKRVLKEVRQRKELKQGFKNLNTVPGIGTILALTIILETGDINRFKKVGNYVSAARLVQSKRLSNEKKKGEGNRKSGNKYLCWAYVEAAHTAISKYEDINRYYQKKEAKTNNIVARKTIAHKLARASYFIIKDNTVFDMEKLFGPSKMSKEKGAAVKLGSGTG